MPKQKKRKGKPAPSRRRHPANTMLCAFPEKKQYWSQIEAEKDLVTMQFKGKAGLDVHTYRCPEPGAQHWHIGHSKVLLELLRRLAARAEQEVA